MFFYLEDVGDLACKLCLNTQEKSPMLICDKCSNANHASCSNTVIILVGMWVC